MRTFARRTLCLVVVCVAAVVGIAPAQADDSLPDPGWVMTATTVTTNLVDGQPVTLNVKSRSDVAVNHVTVRECRLGPDYSDAIGGIDPDAGNCSPVPISSSAFDSLTRSASDGLTVLARSPGGANFTFLVGTGTVTWNSTGGARSLTCDQSHTCALVSQLNVDTSVNYVITPLVFVDADPLASCGGPATGSLASAGSDELSDAWSTWTRAFCAKFKHGAPSRAAFLGENESVDSFARSSIDIAFTGAGYNADVGFTDLDAAHRRAAVAIPIALNASVIAAGGGFHQIVSGQPIGDKVGYGAGSLRLSTAEAGALLGGGAPWVFQLGGPYIGSILNRNPALNGIPIATGAGVMAPSLALSSTWFMTKYLATLAPDDFVDPSHNPPTKRSATPSLATAAPPYDPISLFTGRPVLGKATLAAFLSGNDGPMWVVTDRVTATALGLTTVAIENAAHDFVAPTTDAMNAAVSTMQPDANGLLQPDVAATTSGSLSASVSVSSSVTPYPLTYVEYAMVPAEALVDTTTCVARTASQALLAQWLDYILGDGQQNLPAGMEPLPSSLLNEAKASVAKVGKSTVTGACAGRVTYPTTAGATAPVAAAIPPAASIPLSAGGVPGAYPASVPQTRPNERRVIIPRFAGNTVPGGDAGALALLGIVLAMSLGVFITSRHLSPRVAALVGADGAEVGGAAAGGAVVAGAMAGGAVTAPEPAPTGSPERRIAMLVALWTAIGIAGVALVVYPLAGLFTERDQRALLSEYRQTLSNAAHADEGLQTGSVSTKPPEIGSAVGVLEIGALKVQDVVIEGIEPSQTRKGPGHVPGTAGLGQPSNSVLVGRRNSFGGTFLHLGNLARGDKIVVTTTQGQSVYGVTRIGTYKLVEQDPKRAKGETTRDELFGPTTGDRLTLVTSGSRRPLNENFATVVVAKLQGRPFAPTRQGARTDQQTSLGSDSSAWPTILLAMLAWGLAVAASIFAYRKLRFRVAYVLTIAPLVALTVITAEALSRLIPTWT